MSPALHEAIEGVYDAFSKVPRPRSVEGCPCCIDKKGISILLTKALRDLSPEDLTHYASSVFLTVGTLDDFLYFLPRILEILAFDHDWWPDPEVVALAINTAGFRSWPDSRRQVLSQYFNEIILDLLRTEDCGSELDSWICALGRLFDNLMPFLSIIAASGPRLIEFYEVNSQPLLQGRLSNAFWDDEPEAQGQVVNWFLSEEIQRAIQVAYGLA